MDKTLACQKLWIFWWNPSLSTRPTNIKIMCTKNYNSVQYGQVMIFHTTSNWRQSLPNVFWSRCWNFKLQGVKCNFVVNIWGTANRKQYLHFLIFFWGGEVQKKTTSPKFQWLWFYILMYRWNVKEDNGTILKILWYQWLHSTFIIYVKQLTNQY